MSLCIIQGNNSYNNSNNQPLLKVTKSLYIVTILGQLPFTLFTEIAQTWIVQRTVWIRPLYTRIRHSGLTDLKYVIHGNMEISSVLQPDIISKIGKQSVVTMTSAPIR